MNVSARGTMGARGDAVVAALADLPQLSDAGQDPEPRARGSARVTAAVMTEPHAPAVLTSFPAPELERGEVLMRVLYSEVCGTDVHIQKGMLSGVPYPIIPGHYAVGVVEAVSGAVRSVSGRSVLEGELITFLDVHDVCHRCWQCQVDKAPTKCRSRKVYGVTHSAAEGLLGGWSEKVLLKADVSIAHLPEGLTPLRFIAGGCALPTAIHAVERARVALGEIVVVQGAGPVGLCAAMAAYRSGATVVVAERSATRLDAVRRLGFHAIDLGSEACGTASDQLLRYTGGQKADVVIEATGSALAIRDGIGMARDGGRYAIVGHYTNSGETTVNPHLDINMKHLEILGTWGVEYCHLHKGMELLKGGRLSPSGVAIEEVMTRVYALADVQKALEDVGTQRVVKAVISPDGCGEEAP